MFVKRIILFCVLTASIFLLIGCEKTETKNSVGSDDPALVTTEDGHAVFDGKIYENYTVIE